MLIKQFKTSMTFIRLVCKKDINFMKSMNSLGMNLDRLEEIYKPKKQYIDEVFPFLF